MYIKYLAVGVVLGLAAMAPASFAESSALKFEPIRVQQMQIRKDVESRKGIYKGLSDQDRALLASNQTQVLHLIADKQSADDLREDQRTELFNALELIEALINKTDDERMVCEHRAPLGSNFKKRECLTVAQKREAKERARQTLDRSEIQTLR